MSYLGKNYLTEDSDLVKEINKISALIGTSIKSGTITIISPKDSKIEKYKVFDSATEFMIGKSAAYLKLFERDH